MSFPFTSGEVLAGKYRIEELLGEGGMGLVFAATHLGLDQRVAIKVLREQSSAKPEAVARFIREARAAAKIQSHHVARVLDIAFLDSGAPYIVMEYLDGDDLARVLSRVGRLDPVEAVRHVIAACEALAEVHAYGMVHRDLKPANLFLAMRPDGALHVKVLDFGISKVVDDDAREGRPGLTLPSAVLGSPHYMSPEQLRGARDIDGRSDIWALGVTLYELLSGKTPFSGDLEKLCLSVLNDRPRPLSEHRPELADGLVDAVHRCLARDPYERFQSVVELARALAPFGDVEGTFSAERVRRTAARSAPPRAREVTPAARAVTRQIGVGRRSSAALARLLGHTTPRAAPRVGGRLGDRSRVPRVAVERDEIGALAPRDARLLAQIDGVASLDDVLKTCGLPTTEALEVLHRLLRERIIVIDASPNPR